MSRATPHRIPPEVAAEAQQALAWRERGYRGGTAVGWNTAKILSRQTFLFIDKIRHIARYFPRHAVDKKAKGFHRGEPGYPSPGRVAWALWGGDAGRKWAEALAKAEDKTRKSRKGRYTAR